MVRRPATPGRHGATGIRRRDANERQPQERRPADLSGVPNATGGQSAGPVTKAIPRVGPRKETGTAQERVRRQTERGDREKDEDDAHKEWKPKASPKSAAGSGGQANTPATSRKSSSRKVAIE